MNPPQTGVMVLPDKFAVKPLTVTVRLEVPQAVVIAKV